jgi:DNA replication protein DnaC
MRADMIFIDDIGLLPVTTENAEALYRVVDAAYEKRSIALSSNLHPTHIVLTAGDSTRLTQATAGKGVTPLA